MYVFPKDLYTDVRIENVWDTTIIINDGDLSEIKEKQLSGVFIRVFDGNRWYYSSFAGKGKIQEEIDNLSKQAKPNKNINGNPIVKKLQANRDVQIRFEKNSVNKIPTSEKLALLKSYIPELDRSDKIKGYKAQYRELNIVKEFYSSKRADLKFDMQRAGLAYFMTFIDNGKTLMECYEKTATVYDELKDLSQEIREYITLCEDYVKNSESVIPGNYTIVFSPIAAGVFAHEIFGHKSEADFSMGSEVMQKAWVAGKKIGEDFVSIIDSGTNPEWEYVPYDDEGSRGEATYLIENGVLNKRLHSAVTAVSLCEEATGNARAIDYTFEPMVRMTSTYIVPGQKSKDELIAGIKDGIFVDTILAGSGMSVFTIAPNRSYRIENGKITKPLNAAMVSGTVYEAFKNIEAVSKEFDVCVKLTIFCGKPDQLGLRVGCGGPYLKVNNLMVK